MVIKIFSAVLFLILGSEICFAKTVKLDHEQVDLDKNYQQNLDKFNAYFKKKFGSYENLYKASKVSAEDQKLIYYRNETIVKILQDDSVSARDAEVSKKLFSKADEFDQDDLDFDSLNDKFSKLFENSNKRIMKLHAFASVNYLAWEYKLEGVDADKNDINIISQETGGCYGGGVSYGNATWEMRLEGCYGNLKAVVNDPTGQIYGTHHLDVKAAMLSAGAFWKPDIDLLIGISPTYYYHSADYPVVTSGTISDKNKNSVGYLIGLHWYLTERLDFNINIGDSIGYNPSTLKLGLNFVVL